MLCSLSKTEHCFGNPSHFRAKSELREKTTLPRKEALESHGLNGVAVVNAADRRVRLMSDHSLPLVVVNAADRQVPLRRYSSANLPG